MQELIRSVANRTGLSHERATVAVKATLDFLKIKVSEPVTSEIDAALNGSNPSQDPRMYLEHLFGNH